MLELLEQLDSELLTSFNSKAKARATTNLSDAARRRQDDETESTLHHITPHHTQVRTVSYSDTHHDTTVLIQILEDLRLVVQSQVDSMINNRAVAFSDGTSALRSLSSVFSDAMTVLKVANQDDHTVQLDTKCELQSVANALM
jgi:hypothetical protein